MVVILRTCVEKLSESTHSLALTINSNPFFLFNFPYASLYSQPVSSSLLLCHCLLLSLHSLSVPSILLTTRLTRQLARRHGKEIATTLLRELVRQIPERKVSYLDAISLFFIYHTVEWLDCQLKSISLF